MKLSNKVSQLTAIIEPAVTACDVALWGVEFLPQGGRSLMRIYIDALPADKAAGKRVTIEDCAAVTHQVSGVLEVHDPIAGEYVLEVSSPGLDRTFFQVAQLQDYVGETLSLRLITPLMLHPDTDAATKTDTITALNDGSAKRRKLTGKLEAVDDKQLTVTVAEGETFQVAVDNIDKAKLVYQQA